MAGVSLTLAAFAMVVMLPLGNAARTDLGSTPIDVVPGTEAGIAPTREAPAPPRGR